MLCLLTWCALTSPWGGGVVCRKVNVSPWRSGVGDRVSRHPIAATSGCVFRLQVMFKYINIVQRWAEQQHLSTTHALLPVNDVNVPLQHLHRVLPSLAITAWLSSSVSESLLLSQFFYVLAKHGYAGMISLCDSPEVWVVSNNFWALNEKEALWGRWCDWNVGLGKHTPLSAKL